MSANARNSQNPETEKELEDEAKEATKKRTFQKNLLNALKEATGKKPHVVVAPELVFRLCVGTGGNKGRGSGDLPSAMMLSHLVYLCDKGNREDGFIWKSVSEWKEEAGLNPRQVRRAAKWLEGKGLVEVKANLKVHGRETMHFKLNQDKLSTLLADLIINNPSRLQGSNDFEQRREKRIRTLFKSLKKNK